MRVLSAFACAAAVALVLASAGVAVGLSVVLGVPGYEGSQGVGWGTAHPSEIFNGGDPSGLVTNIHWSSWGGPTANGTGKNAIFMPAGGYYKQRVTIQLRATDRGRCTAHGGLVYRKLYSREPHRPGGPAGGWEPWSNDLCRALG